MSLVVSAAIRDIDDRPAAPKFDQWQADELHGVPGHHGYLCRQCAFLSEITVQAAPTGADHWQNLQIAWQEDCDIVFRQHDVDTWQHMSSGTHQPVNCLLCPVPPVMPVKPEPPYERAIGQSART